VTFDGRASSSERLAPGTYVATVTGQLGGVVEGLGSLGLTVEPLQTLGTVKFTIVK
jgi:hypothetical protein